MKMSWPLLLIKRPTLRIHKKAKHLCGAVNAYYQGLFNVCGAARAGVEVHHRGEVIAVFLLHCGKCVINIAHYLVGIGKYYVDGVEHWGCAAHVLVTAYEDRSSAGYQHLAAGYASIGCLQVGFCRFNNTRFQVVEHL